MFGWCWLWFSYSFPVFNLSLIVILRISLFIPTKWFTVFCMYLLKPSFDSHLLIPHLIHFDMEFISTLNSRFLHSCFVCPHGRFILLNFCNNYCWLWESQAFHLNWSSGLLLYHFSAFVPHLHSFLLLPLPKSTTFHLIFSVLITDFSPFYFHTFSLCGWQTRAPSTWHNLSHLMKELDTKKCLFYPMVCIIMLFIWIRISTRSARHSEI